MRKDLTGQKFNRLTVTEFDHLNKRQQAFWKCKCDCGSDTIVQGYKITSGSTKSCGCLFKDTINRAGFVDLSGQVFGKLTVRRYKGLSKDGNIKWLCRCECGNVCTPTTASLNKGTTSCGCAMHRHKMSGTPEYKSWASMISRCTNEKDVAFKNYGARAISVCDRWSDVLMFIEDMGARPEGTTIERIDNEGDYTPDNCKWATMKEQANNKRTNRPLTCRGVTFNLSQWSDLLHIPTTTITGRIDRGWSIDRALGLED